jgi:flagellar biosynthesis GTPase FlhF
LFDGFLEGLKLSGSDTQAYIEKMPSLSRFVMVDGSGGTGKSTGVAKFLWNILKEEGYDILVISNDKDRATALKDTLGVGDEVVKTTSEVLKSILKKDYNISDYTTGVTNGHYILDPTKLPEATLKEANPFTDPTKSKKIMIIDEVTLLDEMQLEIFSEYAQYGKDDVTILGLGDSKQNAKTVTLEGMTKVSGIEDCKYIKAPSLTASLRKTCRGKKLNLNLVGSILSRIEDYRNDNLEKQDNELSEELQKIINDFAGNGQIELAYFDEGGLFGEKFSSDPKSEVDTIIGYLKEGEKLAILVDDAGHAEYADVKEKYGDKVEVLNSAQIQGGQFTYVIVDKTFDTNPDHKRSTFKDFYTAISRSTTGTIIGTKKSDIRKIFGEKIGHVKRHDAAALIINPSDERYARIAQRYRDWRTDLFGLVPESTPASGDGATGATGGTTSGATGGTSSGGTTGGTTGGGVAGAGESLSYDEIKGKISQVRQDAEVTEEDVYDEYANPDNKSEHAKQYRERIRFKKENPTSYIDPEIFEK